MIQGNIVHEVGIYERQGTMWNQALSAKTRLEGNIFFNCDRAALNVNDGFGGGNQVVGNLLFNTGRATNKDEGMFNSWCAAPPVERSRSVPLPACLSLRLTCAAPGALLRWRWLLQGSSPLHHDPPQRHRLDL